MSEPRGGPILIIHHSLLQESVQEWSRRECLQAKRGGGVRKLKIRSENIFAITMWFLGIFTAIRSARLNSASWERQNWAIGPMALEKWGQRGREGRDGGSGTEAGQIRYSLPLLNSPYCIRLYWDPLYVSSYLDRSGRIWTYLASYLDISGQIWLNSADMAK